MTSAESRKRSGTAQEHAAFPDFYAMLNVPENATSEQIKRGYRAAMKRVHPDRASPGEKAEAERTARQLNEAYRVLTDPAARRKYDVERSSKAIQDEIMNRYVGGFGVPGGRNDVYDEILAAARESNRQQRRRNDRHATRSLLTMFVILLAVVVTFVLIWGLITTIGGWL